MKSLTKEQARRFLAQPNGPEKLLQRGAGEFDICCALFEEGYAPAAAYLCRCAKGKELRRRIEAALGDRHALYAALNGESPKLRKNAARLCGQLGRREDAKELIAALGREQTRFVRPSMLLALGALGGDEAEACLKAYTVPPARSEEEKPHAAAEERALSTALKSFLSFEKHPFTGLKEEHAILLTAPDKLADSLARELTGEGFAPDAVGRDYVRLTTGDIAGLYAARSFYEPLIEIAPSIGAHPKGMALKARAFMEEFLPACHEGPPPFGYRIEVRGTGIDRAGITEEMARYMDGELLINSPGSYEAELRVEVRTNGSAALYLRLCTIEDTRFSYRLGALPASMHPVTAAAMLRYGDAYLRRDARVLDPCCGSGTLLIERHKLCRCAALTGVDIVPKTIELARGNIQAAGLEAQLISKDCLRFDTALPYDEVIANLPFGNRIGSHEGNRRLYAGILDRLPTWLKRDGIAMLYTMEYTLLKRLIRERPGLRLMGETRTQAGGLMPAIFIIKLG